MRILVTGFDAFGVDTINPASLILPALPTHMGEHEILTQVIPTVAYTSLEKIIESIEQWHPNVILSLGQAGGRADITIERIGINLNDFRIPDNAGNKLLDAPINPTGPDAYFTNLPIKKMRDALIQKGIPCSLSNSAGTFICNHVLYGVRDYCCRHALNIQSGFVHVPYLPEQVLTSQKPSMHLQMQQEAVKTMLEVIIEEGVKTK